MILDRTRLGYKYLLLTLKPEIFGTLSKLQLTMDLSLGVAVSLSSFVLSPAIHLAKRKDIKPAFTQIVSSDSFPPGLYSIAGAIALGFLNVSIQKYSVLDHDDALWRAPGSLQVPTPTLMPTSTPSSPRPTTNPTKQVFSLAATLCAFLIGFAYVMHLASSTNNICSPPSEPLSNYNGSRRPAQPNGGESFTHRYIDFILFHYLDRSRTLSLAATHKASVGKSTSQP